MILKYEFTDTDTGFEEYDIAGEEYKSLLEICFEYSSSVSFRIWNQEPDLPDAIEIFRIPVTDDCLKAYRHYYSGHSEKSEMEIFHYDLTNEVKEYISSVTDSIFKWINGWGFHNPEDLCFYRKDGSIFFCSVVHDGVCYLFAEENEDVRGIVMNSRWRNV